MFFEKKMILKIFLIGFIILFFAIIINLIANYFNINGWYSFLNSINDIGLKESFLKQSLISLVFLFLIYPFLLGLVGYLSFYFLENLK